MAVLVVARRQQYFQPGKGSGRNRATSFQHCCQFIPGLFHFGQCAANGGRPDNRGRSLPQCAGFYILAKVNHPAINHINIDGDRRAAQGGAALGGRHWRSQATVMRDISGQRQNSGRIQLYQVILGIHRLFACFRIGFVCHR